MSLIIRLVKSTINLVKYLFLYVIRLEWIRFSIEDLFIPIAQKNKVNSTTFTIDEIKQSGLFLKGSDLTNHQFKLKKGKEESFNFNKLSSAGEYLGKVNKNITDYKDDCKDINKDNHKDEEKIDNGRYIGLDRVESGSDRNLDKSPDKSSEEPPRSTLKGSQEKTHEKGTTGKIAPLLTQEIVDKIGDNHMLNTPFLDMIGGLPSICGEDDSFEYPFNHQYFGYKAPEYIPPGPIQVTGLDQDEKETITYLSDEPGSEKALMEGGNSPDFVNVDDLEFDEPLPIVLKTDSFSSESFIDDTDKLKDFPTDQKFPYCRQQDYISESVKPVAVAKVSNSMNIKEIRPDLSIGESLSFKDKVEKIKKDFCIDLENQFLANAPLISINDNSLEDIEKPNTDKYPVSRKSKEYLKKYLGPAIIADKKALQDKKFNSNHQDGAADDLNDLDKIGHN